MRIYKREFNRLTLAKTIVNTIFPDFGINKKQEIIRLLYEISKRENIDPCKIIIQKDCSRDYNLLKKQLLHRRYPYASSLNHNSFKPHLPKIELRPSDCFVPRQEIFYPKNIVVEKSAASSFLTRRLKNIFTKSRFIYIDSLNNYLHKRRRFGITDYNRRGEIVFVVNEMYDFFKKCPCTKSAHNCGYHIFNLGFGCIYECNYCYLQDYTNSPGIILPANIDDFFREFYRYKKAPMRIGTGEFCDSLAFDKITHYSISIVEFFRKQKGVIFEFKTKSDQIENLIKTKHNGRIVISWSLNPQSVIENNEFLTPSLEKRLNAAIRCAESGFKLGFHLDPVIYYRGWEQEYMGLIEDLFSRIKPRQIAWISIGTFRFKPSLKQIIERRFPGNKILDEELLLGYDNKLRYPYPLRYKMYKRLTEALLKHSRQLNIYLCMEEISMWKSLKLKMPNFFNGKKN